MLLKVLIYAYLNNIYSSRKIEKQLHETLISCGCPGSPSRISEPLIILEASRLVGKFDYIFTQVVEHLHSEGLFH